MSLNRLGPKQRGLKSEARRETGSDDVVQCWGMCPRSSWPALLRGGPDRRVLLWAVGCVCAQLVFNMRPQAGNLLVMWELDSRQKCEEDQGHTKAMLGKFEKQIFQRPQDRLF